MRTTVVACTALAAAMLCAARPVLAQDTNVVQRPSLLQSEPQAFGPTLDFGTGLITIPTAWVSPKSSDFFISISGIRIPSAIGATNSLFSYFNGNGAIDTHWLGRFDVGFSLYSNNPEYGFFGSVLVVKDHQFFSWMPAISAGVRNLGPYPHEDRYLIGHDITVDSAGFVKGFTPIFYKHFHTAPTFYGVATKSFELPVPIPSSVSVTVGEGSGLFSEDGRLGNAYSTSFNAGTGFFFGLQGSTHPIQDLTLSLLGENDGWEFNFGGRAEYRGLGLGIYGLEMTQGGRHLPQAELIYNYKKIAVVFSYAGNFKELSRGVFLRSEISDLERQQQIMKTEIARREHKIQQLQVQLTKLQGSALSDVDRQRQQLETQLKEEQDAIRRASERLQQLQQGQKPQ
ncbi:MAG TPA: OmpH family outer membrane protein [Gemmatimonadaceae bacterium]|jgi:hypothetical protein|nr:OmpH family outer membrane protein [Gemmatimonadaceae bacterium]